MKTITIEWLSDSYDCDTCGMSYADGAKVFLDGVIILDLTPVAHCYDGSDYNQADIYKKILEVLEYKIVENDY